MNHCCCQSSKPTQLTVGKVCPICGKKGQRVSYKTVHNLVREKESLVDEDYNICMTADCAVVYYCDTNTISQSEMTVPVWFKKGANPVILCYCSNLTDEDLRRASEKLESHDFDEIIKHLGGMENCDCEQNNPTGKCCIETMRSFVERI